MSGGRCRSTPVPAVEDEGKQPPRESRAREERDEGDRNELGLFGERPLAALLYIGREGRRDPTAIVPAPVPAVGAGRARVVSACWDSNPGTGPGPGRVVRGPCLNDRVRAGPMG
jgi:hypothetical protein